MLILAWLVGAILLLSLVVAGCMLRPFKEPHRETPADHGLGFETLRFPVPGGSLAGWFLSHPDAQGRTIVLLHGICSNKSRFIEHGRELQQRGFNVLLLDLRGHGESSRGITTYGVREQEEVGYVLDALSERGDVDAIVLMGHSMGGAVALQTLPHPKVRAVVADSAFSSLPEVLAHRTRRFRLPALPLLALARLGVTLLGQFDLRQVSPLETLKATDKPVFLVHGTADRSVPHSHSHRMATEAPHAWLWSIPDVGHLDAWRVLDYFDRVALFAHAVCN
ncbi:MAG TPA: alpha/beta fold hydrolase [Candidatus Xenobia bacterium]